MGYKAAVVQMNSQPDYEESLSKASDLLKDAAEQGAKLVALPENFAFLGSESEKMEHAVEIANRCVPFYEEHAQTLGIYILAGGYPVRAESGKAYNRSVLVSPKGKTLAQYDKMHLFDVEIDEEHSYRESDSVERGDSNAVVYASDELGTIGLSICYDVRFPELYRAQVEQGAQILTVPSAFTEVTGEAHWHTLLRSRAIENSCYVLAPAQTGLHGEKRRTYGHSLIINPWGEILADAGKEPGVAMAEIDLQEVEDVRKRLPSIYNRVM